MSEQTFDDEQNLNTPSTSHFDECNANQIDDFSTSSYQGSVRTPSSVMQRLSNLMIRNNVSFR